MESERGVGRCERERIGGNGKHISSFDFDIFIFISDKQKKSVPPPLTTLNSETFTSFFSLNTSPCYLFSIPHHLQGVSCTSTFSNSIYVRRKFYSGIRKFPIMFQLQHVGTYLKLLFQYTILCISKVMLKYLKLCFRTLSTFFEHQVVSLSLLSIFTSVLRSFTSIVYLSIYLNIYSRYIFFFKKKTNICNACTLYIRNL